MSPAEVVAVIGVGRIGLPVCGHLVRAGYRVIAVDVLPERRALAGRAGAIEEASPARVADQADVVLTVLPGSPELRALMVDEALLEDLRPGTTWIDLTSAAPELGQQLAAAATQRGVHMLEAPLGGGAGAAEQAQLTFFVGGDPDVLTGARPLLQHLARPDGILYQGPAGSGYLTKLLVNTLWFGQALATAEVMLLAQAAGLDLLRLREVLTGGPAASDYIARYLPSVFAGDYLPSFGLERIVEELDSVRESAQAHGVPFELSGLVADLHARALQAFGPVDGELMGVAYLEQQAGRTIRPS
jgi:3-hydroxyisobutyrate dehydrogenase